MKKPMKKIIPIAALAISLCACTIENVDLDKKQIEQWELVKITGSQTQTIVTGDQMDFQETYTIYSDSTFTKSRIKNYNNWTVTGTYNYLTYENEKYIVLNYSDVSEIIGNCSSNLKEVLKFSSNNETTNTWHLCDGPKLDYRKKEN